MNEETIALFKKYINRACTPDELDQVIAIIARGEHQAEWDAVLSGDALDIINNGTQLNMEPDEMLSLHERIMVDIHADQYQPSSGKKTIRLWSRITAAASIVICMGIGLYFYQANHKKEQADLSIARHDFKPGGNKAILTLAGGKQILLTGAANGRLALQGNTVISKTSDGQVVYNTGKSSGSEMLYNTMSTPPGGQYHLILADGTGVWLNAASSIKYPTTFNGPDRKVEITGEVYFEVTHNKAKPFRVISNGQAVEVLGTQFNVNAYYNEMSIKTTLIKGSVRVSANGAVKILKPGQQSTVSQSGISLRDVDPDEAVAWKEGYFDFSETDIKTIMRQFSRWYDVDIQFDGPATSETFTGRIPRNWKLSQVIKIVQSSKSVHLTVQGRRIMVKQ